MFEQMIIDYCTVNKLIYDDYIVSRGGKLRFYAHHDKTPKKLIEFEVYAFNPFRVMQNTYTKNKQNKNF